MSTGARKETLKKMLAELAREASGVLGMTAVYWEGQDFPRGQHPLDPLEKAINKARRVLRSKDKIKLR